MIWNLRHSRWSGLKEVKFWLAFEDQPPRIQSCLLSDFNVVVTDVTCGRTSMMYRASTVMYIGSTEVGWRDRVFDFLRNIRFLSPTLASLFPSFPFFFWCPQWATRARLRPFKNMEPVWPEWLLWKSSGLPDGLSPTRGGPQGKKKEKIRWRKVLFLTIAPRAPFVTRSLRYRMSSRTNASEGWPTVRVPLSWFHISRQYRGSNVKRDVYERAICRVQTDGEAILSRRARGWSS